MLTDDILKSTVEAEDYMVNGVECMKLRKKLIRS